MVLLLRLLAEPVGLRAAEPGTVVLCLGGQLVEVRLAELDDAPPQPAEAEPCPWFGTAPGIDNAEPVAIALPAPRARMRAACGPGPSIAPAPRTGYCARAPPRPL